MELNSLKYPKKSHRKTVLLPPNSIDLSEFMGIYLGDGGLNNPWQLSIYLNSESDYDFSFYIQNLIHKLFGIICRVKVRPEMNCRVIVASGISMINFLVSKGIVRGSKVKQQIDVPSWIKGNLEYERAFVRGLFDTDGGFYTHTHCVSGRVYTNLGFCFASFSLPLILSVAQILSKYGINPHITRQGRRIELYSKKDLDTYITQIGSSNPRLYLKYQQWRGVRVV